MSRESQRPEGRRPGWRTLAGLAAVVVLAAWLGWRWSDNRLTVTNASGQELALLRVVQLGSTASIPQRELLLLEDVLPGATVEAPFVGGMGKGMGLDAYVVLADGRDAEGWESFYDDTHGHRVHMTVDQEGLVQVDAVDVTWRVWLLAIGVLVLFVAALRPSKR